MAVVTLGHNITRVEAFNSAPAGTITSNPGGGPGAAFAAGLQYEGAGSLARRINATGADHGFFYQHTADIDWTAAATTVIYAKSYCVLTAINSHRFRVGPSETANFEWMIADDGTLGDNEEYLTPAKGGYVIRPIEVRKTAWITQPENGSTTDITASDGFGVIYNVATTTGAGLSSSMDAIDITTDGLFLWGGDSTDPDGVFQDFVDADEGAGLTGAERVGMWTILDGVMTVFGAHVIGRQDDATVTATVFQAIGNTLVFPGGFVGAGFNSLELDLGNATTDIDLTSVSMIGRGRTDLKNYFDTELSVSTANDRITITGHGFVTGDQVRYDAEGGTEDIGPDATNGEAEDLISTGPTTGPFWYVDVFDVDEFALHPTMEDALQATNIETMTASSAGNGELHSLRRTPDTRPDLTIVGTSGAGDLTACALTSLRDILMTSASTLTSCILLNGQSLTIAGGTLDTCVIDGPTLPVGEAFITALTSADLANIDDCVFISGGFGHAIEVTTTGTTVGFVGNTLTGYGPGTASSAGVHDNEFDTGTDVTGGATDTITLATDTFVTGDAISYADEGGSQNIGLTDDQIYWVRRDSANTFGIFLTEQAALDNANRIDLTAGGSETHTLYSANAAFHNSSGGTVTLQVSGGGSTPTVRNSNGSQTNVENNVQVTFDMMRDNSEVRVFLASTGEEIAGIENATAGSLDNRNFAWSAAVGLSVNYKIHNWLAGVAVYETIAVNGFTVPATNQTIIIQQRLDRNAV